jgi:hypothetical protein
MAGRLGAFLALALVLAPVAAGAEGVDFTVPDQYQVAPSPSAAARTQAAGVFRDWDRTIDGVRHSLVASNSPSGGRDLPSIIDATVAGIKARGGVDVVQADAAPLCGAPSVRVAYSYPNRLTFTYRYVVLGDRLLIASYAHPPNVAGDPAALAALDTLCSGMHHAGTPAGWHVVAPFPGFGTAWLTPDLQSSLIEMVSSLKPGDDVAPAPYKGKVPVANERSEPCGGVTIRRVTATDGQKRVEWASGVVRGFSYANAYGRPATAPADPAALAALTSFCAPGAMLARPPPRAPSPAPGR